MCINFIVYLLKTPSCFTFKSKLPMTTSGVTTRSIPETTSNLSTLHEYDLLCAFWKRRHTPIHIITATPDPIPLVIIQIINNYSKYVCIFDIFDTNFVSQICNKSVDHFNIVRNNRVVSSKAVQNGHECKIKCMTPIEPWTQFLFGCTSKPYQTSSNVLNTGINLLLKASQNGIKMTVFNGKTYSHVCNMLNVCVNKYFYI